MAAKRKPAMKQNVVRLQHAEDAIFSRAAAVSKKGRSLGKKMSKQISRNQATIKPIAGAVLAVGAVTALAFIFGRRVPRRGISGFFARLFGRNLYSQTRSIGLDAAHSARDFARAISSANS